MFERDVRLGWIITFVCMTGWIGCECAKYRIKNDINIAIQWYHLAGYSHLYHLGDGCRMLRLRDPLKHCVSRWIYLELKSVTVT